MAEQEKGTQYSLKGKIMIEGSLRVVTGLHIGSSSDFAPIGAVDSPFIRDPLTHLPVIPGSSLKGKIRTLLAKSRCEGYILNEIEKDDEIISRLFGAAGKDYTRPARLQFFDLFMKKDSVEKISQLETDTYIGEVKSENTISRISGTANPRQIERVPAGAEFAFRLVYNVEVEAEAEEDLQVLCEGLDWLEADYLGGHGSRGYGRVKWENLCITVIGEAASNKERYENIMKR